MEREWRMVADLEDTVEEAISTARGIIAMQAATKINHQTYLAIAAFQFPNLYLTAYVDRWMGDSVEEFNQRPVLNRATVLLLWDAFQKPTKP